MRDSNACDFDDLLGLAVALLRANEAVRSRYLARFRHVGGRRAALHPRPGGCCAGWRRHPSTARRVPGHTL